MAKRPYLYWIACATHSLDLILHDFAKFEAIKNLLDDAKCCTNHIYNHSKILHNMRNHCTGDLIKPTQTQFATNYVDLSSLLEHKNRLQRMVTSDD